MGIDLITLALVKKSSGGGGVVPEDLIPYIGENGNWYIKGEDSGISALPNNNLEVDGLLKVDTENQRLLAVKDGVETVVGEVASIISDEKISALFNEEGNVDGD